jgi:hypothetical protein
MHYIKYLFLPILSLLIFQQKVYSQTQFEKQYRLRCDSTLNYFSSSSAQKSLFSVMAKYATGKADSTTAKLLDSLIENPNGNMFWMYPVTGIYFYGRKNLTHFQKDKIIQAFAHYTADTGITENHKLMFYASLYLMSSEDGKDTIQWFNKKSSSVNKKLSGYILGKWMDQVFTKGFAEFNSPHYAGYYLSPLLMLYDFSKDKEIKSHAEILLWRILGDYLSHYHNSAIGGASKRVVDEDIFNKKNSQSAQLLRFLLGDAPLFYENGKPVNVNYHTLFFALSSFTFPETLNSMWKEEQKHPFEEIDAERVMSKVRFSSGRNEEVTTYLYSDSLYSLASIIDGHDDEIQTRTWSLDWSGKGKSTTLFGLNPYMSKTALAAYYPGNINTLYMNILKQRPFYNDTNKWIGGCPYENLFQYKNVLLGIYNFPDTLLNNAVSFFISNDIDTLKLENKTLYAKTGSICFVLRFSESLVISDVNYGKRYRIRGKKPAFILEVYDASEYNSFNDFEAKIKKEVISFSLNKVAFTGADNTKIQLSADGDKLFNGKEFVLPPDTLYKSPFMNIANGVIIISTSSEKVILDWNKPQITHIKNL